ADPLRTLRVARFACELDLDVDPGTAELVRESAPRLAGVSPERVFAELRRVVASPRPRFGVELAAALGVLEPALPEVADLRGVEQNRYHDSDVYRHTLAV